MREEQEREYLKTLKKIEYISKWLLLFHQCYHFEMFALIHNHSQFVANAFANLQSGIGLLTTTKADNQRWQIENLRELFSVYSTNNFQYVFLF